MKVKRGVHGLVVAAQCLEQFLVCAAVHESCAVQLVQALVLSFDLLNLFMHSFTCTMLCGWCICVSGTAGGRGFACPLATYLPTGNVLHGLLPTFIMVWLFSH